MTYGRSAAALRDALGSLLAVHRVRAGLDGRDPRRELVGRLFADGYSWNEIQQVLGIGRELLREYHTALRDDGLLPSTPVRTAAQALEDGGYDARRHKDREQERQRTLREAVSLLVEHGYEHQQIGDALGVDMHTVLRYRRTLEADGWHATTRTAAQALADAGLEVPDRTGTPRGGERSAAYRRLIGYLRGRGHEQQEIADTLGLHVATVRSYQRRLEAAGWTPDPRPDPRDVLSAHGLDRAPDVGEVRDESRAMVAFLTDRGYTQEEIGDALGLDRSSVGRHQAAVRPADSSDRLVAPHRTRPRVPIEQAVADLAIEIPERATPEERTATAEQIMRYRAEVIDYLSAVVDRSTERRFATPDVAAADPTYPLHVTVGQLRDAAGQRPTAADLGNPQPIRVVELWRQAAVAALAGRERDLPQALIAGQRAAALGDAIAALRTLIALDERYAAARGWRRLPLTVGTETEGWAVPAVVLDAVARVADRTTVDFSLDRQGPPDVRPAGPPPAGVAAAADALARAAYHLAGETEPVTTPVMRWLVDAQRRTAAYARHHARALGLDEVADHHGVRYRRYADVDASLTDVAGTAGCETLAVVEVADAVRLLKHTRRVTESGLTDLTIASDDLDRAIAWMLRVAQAGYYFQRTERLAIERPGGSVVRRAVPVYVPITPESNPAYGHAWFQLEALAAPQGGTRSPHREAFTAHVQALAADTLAVAQARNLALYPDDDPHRAHADTASAEVIAGTDTLDAAGAAFADARARLVGALAASTGTLAELGTRCGLDPTEIARLIEPARAITVGSLPAAGTDEHSLGGKAAGVSGTAHPDERLDAANTMSNAAGTFDDDCIDPAWGNPYDPPLTVGGLPNLEGPGP